MFTLNKFYSNLFKLNLIESKNKICLNMKKINYNYSLYNNNTKSFSFYKRTVQKLRNRNYNFYEVLGVERECTNEQIRAAYLKLAKQYHPDINKDPGSDEKFKTITLAYEALSNQRNRDLYDAYMNNDPYSSEWKYKEEMYREDQQDSARNFYKERAKYDKYSENYKHQDESNFWKGGREDFTKDFYKDFENIFTSTPGGGYHKPKKDLKADDVLIEITILFEDSFFGAEKGVSFDRVEKCKSCNGYRSERGHRPSRCFTCNGLGEIKTTMFNSKKCNQCKGTGVLIKYPCK
jgi:molecular chaperone DnaJ